MIEKEKKKKIDKTIKIDFDERSLCRKENLTKENIKSYYKYKIHIFSFKQNVSKFSKQIFYSSIHFHVCNRETWCKIYSTEKENPGKKNFSVLSIFFMSHHVICPSYNFVNKTF